MKSNFRSFAVAFPSKYQAKPEFKEIFNLNPAVPFPPTFNFLNLYSKFWVCLFQEYLRLRMWRWILPAMTMNSTGNGAFHSERNNGYLLTGILKMRCFSFWKEQTTVPWFTRCLNHLKSSSPEPLANWKDMISLE